MDILTGLKASSIVLTGMFGILGLSTEFRNKRTKKITLPGWVSLGGIVLSSCCGVVVQLKESSDDAAKALVIAQRSEQTLANIQRTMHPLTGPRVDISFKVLCDADAVMRKYCKDQEILAVQEPPPRLHYPPQLPKSMYFGVDFFIKGHDPRTELRKIPFSGDWNVGGMMSLQTTRYDSPELSFGTSFSDLEYIIFAYSVPINQITGNGKLASVLDIPGSTMVFHETPEMVHMKPSSVGIRFNSGESIGCGGPFTPITGVWFFGSDSAWTCHVPEANSPR